MQRAFPRYGNPRARRLLNLNRNATVFSLDNIGPGEIGALWLLNQKFKGKQ
jgi:hypothetical protein